MPQSTRDAGPRPVIRTVGRTKRYGPRWHSIASISPSTLARSTGRAELFGLDAFREPITAHRRVAYVASEPDLWPAVTAEETLDRLAGLHGGTDTGCVGAGPLLARRDLITGS